MSEMIIVTSATGESWEMTPDQIEAAYRYQNRKYRIMDAEHMIEEHFELCNEDKEEFKEEYGYSYDDMMADADYLADKFLDYYDCDIPENTIWETVFNEYTL